MAPSGGGPWARFDDLAADRALAFEAPEAVLSAWELAEVGPLLAEVERRVEGGAWAYGFVAYEAAPGLDPVLRTRPPQPGLPLVWFALTERPREVPVVALDVAGQEPPRPWACDWDETRHRDAVETIRAAIARGESYQVNLTTRLRGRVPDLPSDPGRPPRWYVELALAQQGRYHAYLDIGSHVIGSASPELFVELTGPDGRDVLMRPMKGTAPRGRDAVEDRQARRRLLASAKERAENVMIVDLLRNDLTRVAETGSVAVPVLRRAERYPTVFQLTADVTARLRPQGGLVELFRALFPCGSITGAPKPRTMELIAAVEDAPRGVYCGAIGMLAPPGEPVRARFSVAIRTVVVERASGAAVYGVGGGITWSSTARREYAELHAKARVLAEPSEDFHLLETMRHEQGRGVHLLERHLARLAASADYVGFSCDLAQVRERLREATAEAGDAKVRLQAFRDGSLQIDVGPLPAPSTGPLRLVIDGEPVDSRAWRLRHKTSDRTTYDVRRARHPGADEVLLSNERGELTEATTANVAVLLAGRWCTPPVGAGLLPGVERAELLADGTLTERAITLAELREADGIALINALRGWRPAVLA